MVSIKVYFFSFNSFIGILYGLNFSIFRNKIYLYTIIWLEVHKKIQEIKNKLKIKENMSKGENTVCFIILLVIFLVISTGNFNIVFKFPQSMCLIFKHDVYYIWAFRFRIEFKSVSIECRSL